MFVETTGPKTKYRPPHLPGNAIIRERLVDFLHQHVHSRLILVSAPAGYGKTTLLVQFAQSTDIPVCWCCLEPLDRDVKRFLTSVIESLRCRFPDFGRGLDHLVREASNDTVVAAMVNALEAEIPHYFVLVLDDYQEADTPEVNQVLQALLRHLPENCHIILASRHMPRVGLARLMAGRDVVGLGPEQLRFTEAEIAQFLDELYGLRPGKEELSQIARQSEGWITGILLATQIVGATELGDLTAWPETPLFAYLGEEVLDRQSPEVRSFLLESSVLRDISAPLCDTLLSTSRSAQFLVQMEAQHLFISNLGGTPPSYRYHSLFRDFLQQALKGQNPSRYNELHSRAGQLLENTDSWEYAVSHYIEACAYDQTALLIAERGNSIFRQGRWQTLDSFLKALPAPVVEGSGRLLLLQGRIAIQRGEPEGAISILARAYPKLSDEARWGDAGRALLVRSNALRSRGDLESGLQESLKAIDFLTQHGVGGLILGEAYHHLAIGYHRKGDNKRFLKALLSAKELYEQEPQDYNLAFVRDSLCLAYRRLGDMENAIKQGEWARQGWLRLGNKARLSQSLNNLSTVYYEKGDAEVALRLAEEAVALAREGGDKARQAWALVTRGRALQALGFVAEASESHSEAVEKAREGGEAQALAAAYDGLANAYREKGELEKAEGLLRQALMECQGRSDFENALFSLSLGTVFFDQGKYQQSLVLLDKACEQLASGPSFDLARALLHRADALLACGQQDSAESDLSRAVETVDATGSREFLCRELKFSPILLEFAISRQTSGNLFRWVKDKISVSRPVARDGQKQALAPAEGRRLLRVYAFSLGDFRVQREAHAITDAEWQSVRAKEMMFYLLYHDKWVRKEALIDALWPELPPGRANSLFRTTLYRLRKVVHPEAVLFEAGRLRLNPLGRFWHDASDFERLVGEATRLPGDSLDKGPVLERALDLYKGPFLEDVYSEWADPIRTRLDVLYQKSLLDLVKFLMSRDNHRRALELCETLIHLDDSNEEFYALAVKCSALAGDHELATRYLLQYEAKTGDTVATPQGNMVARTYRTLVSGSRSTLA